MKQDNTFQQHSEMEENYTLICKIANKVFSQWEGKVVEGEKEISIISNNMLGEKRVECVVNAGLLNSEKYPFTVGGCEKTYSILGGCGCPCENEKEVEEKLEEMLKRFQFRQKQQLSLFDFAY